MVEEELVDVFTVMAINSSLSGKLMVEEFMVVVITESSSLSSSWSSAKSPLLSFLY